MLFDRKRHQMDLKQADATLQNVFKACDIPPNTVAFDRLALRRKLNTIKGKGKVKGKLVLNFKIVKNAKKTKKK